MIGSITRGSKTERSIALVSLLTALSVSGAFAGCLVAVLGSAVSESARFGLGGLVIGLLLLIFALREFGWVYVPLLYSRWQVPATWVRGSALSRSLIWGMLLGPGFLTMQPHPIFHAAIMWIFVWGDPGYGALLGATLALFKALPVIAETLSPKMSTDWRLLPYSFALHIQYTSGSLLLFSGLSLLAAVVINLPASAKF